MTAHISRPDKKPDKPDKLDKRQDRISCRERELYCSLAMANVSFVYRGHQAVPTVQDSRSIDWQPPAGTETKNLFLTNKRKTHYWLVTAHYQTRIDLKRLRGWLGVTGGGLSFASPDALMRCLGVLPGSVTVLGIFTAFVDESLALTVVLDRQLVDRGAVCVHPLRNTASVVVPVSGLRCWLSELGCSVVVMDFSTGEQGDW